MVIRWMMSRNGPFDYCEICRLAADRRQQPLAQGLQHQNRDPLMANALLPDLAVLRPLDHPLEMIVGLAEIMDGGREQHTSTKAVKVCRLLQSKGRELIGGRCIKHLSAA